MIGFLYEFLSYFATNLVEHQIFTLCLQDPRYFKNHEQMNNHRPTFKLRLNLQIVKLLGHDRLIVYPGFAAY